MASDVLFDRQGVAGLITLNRPGALNALTLDMARAMHLELLDWAADDSIKLVIVRGAGAKAFCAGGDIRALYDSGQAGTDYIKEFYWHEYRLDTLIKRYPKPYVALIDGVVMGGGVGVSVHGSHRIASERISFAMPETGIGLFPDVGGTSFLPRCPGETGMYLGLTGARLGVADAIYTGIATDYVPSSKFYDLIDDLSAAQYTESPIGQIDALVTRHAQSSHDEPPLIHHRPAIDSFFARTSIEDIISGLESEGDEWAQETAKTIRSKSPLCTKVAFRQLREGKHLEFEDCMRLEYRLARRSMAGKDFYEGVRAAIIDKDQTPKWEPASLDEVTDEMVEAYFVPLGDEELHFD